MAALEWIKLSCGLHDKWQVLAVRRALKLRTADEVVGKLCRLWSHFENHSKAGRIKGLVPEDIDLVVGKKGFAAAVAAVDWLAFDDQGAVIPAYDEYMGAAARARDAEAEKKRQQRADAAERERQARDHAGTTPGQAGDMGRDGPGTDPGHDGGQTGDTDGTQEGETEAEGEKNPPTPPAGGDGPAGPAGEKARLKAEAAARKAALDGRFAAFWAAYPKKQSKPDAERAFARLSPGPDLLRLILAAVATQKTWHAWAKDGGQYIPNAATWLNARRWEDEPPAVAPAAKPPPRTARDADDAFTAQMFADAFPPDAFAPAGDPP